MSLILAFMEEHPGLHRAICQSAVETLNEALIADPVAVNQFFALQVVVNTDELRDHPTIQVGSREGLAESIGAPLEPEDSDTVAGKTVVMRAMGLINGLFGLDGRGQGFLGVFTKSNPTPDDWIDYFMLADGSPATPDVSDESGVEQ